MLRQIVHTINQALRLVITGLIVGYRVILSPLLRNRCRFYPTCSVYAKTAVQRFGWFKGGCLTIGRLLRCHPLHPGGIDDVPTKDVKEHGY